MKCLTCEIEIDPKWTYAIETNKCPFCGLNIMEEHLKSLFSSLRQTMDVLVKDYPLQTDDWMLSNYSYIQTTSPNIKLYAPKLDLRNNIENKDDENITSFNNDNEEEIGPEGKIIKKHSEEATSAFFKRAEVLKPNIDGFKSIPERAKYIKSLAQQIKKEGAIVEKSQSSNLVDQLPQDMIDAASPEAIAEYRSLMSGADESESYNDNDGDDMGEEIPASVLAMANNSSGKNNADLIKLQQQQDRIKLSRQNFKSGGKGSFSRSS